MTGRWRAVTQRAESSSGGGVLVPAGAVFSLHVKRAEPRRIQAHLGANKLNPNAAAEATAAELKHLRDPAGTNLVAPAGQLSLCLMVFSDCCFWRLRRPKAFGPTTVT